MHGALELLARCGAVERSLGERRIIQIAHDVLDALMSVRISCSVCMTDVNVEAGAMNCDR